MDLPRSINPVIKADKSQFRSGQVDQHVHDEQAADDALFDVLNIRAALGQEGRDLRDDPFLVFPEHTDDGENFGHGQSVKPER